jgi:hypothetical protein
MKKSLMVVLFVLALLISSVVAVNAADFTPITVADLFDWGATGEEVFAYVNAVEGLTCEPSEDEDFGKTINCTTEGLEDETDLYTFFFTDDEALYMVEADVNYLGDSLTLEDLFNSMAESFSEVEMEPYTEGKYFDMITEGSEIFACGHVPDAAYVCLTATAETADTYPYASVIYTNPENVSAFDQAE